jgi:3-hydroxy-9,10-secoandrosta-1,3,5(10)-triene-9,17-dione monooxygenase
MTLEAPVLPVPEPGVGADDLLARARALVPVLRERAGAADTARRMPDETLADLLDAGIFRIVQPRRFGGYQVVDFRTFEL